MSQQTKTLDILLVEDDREMADFLTDYLKSKSTSVRVRQVRTESEFYRIFPAIAATPPDIIVLDVMFPSAPDLDQDRFTAGVRCFKKLRDTTSTAQIPVIFSTVVSDLDAIGLSKPLPPHVLYLVKPYDPSTLFTFIRSLAMHLPEMPEKRRSFLQRAFDAVEVKPGGFGLKIDLKKMLDDKTVA